ncbi:MAG TPA: metallophosphoesterase [Vitreimonas sp.]|nr:metallophosphoesterase [Vitreimonas sp.]
MEIVHFTDPHFGCENIEAIRAATRYVADHKPDLVICTGDISTLGLASELEAACAWLRSLAAPVMLTPGNHDVPYHNPLGRALYPWDRFNHASRGLRVSPWHTKDWCIVPINTARAMQMRLNWAQGAITHAQTEAAAQCLREAQPGALRVVITHHPLDWPNDAPIHGKTFRGPRAQAALIEDGAELFLSGHLHFASARMIGQRALSITSGTLSCRVRHEPCAFTVIRRPAADVIEAEVVHIVQGVCETATKRQFSLSGAQRVAAPAELHPQPG